MSEKDFLKKILVPVDGSGSSLMAVETAAIIAKKAKASVTVLNATQKLMLSIPLPKSIETEIYGIIEQEVEKIVNDAKEVFVKEGISVDTAIIKWSHPADSILKLSKKYDLVVMGAHGENEKEPYSLGSVTKHVIGHITCPTLIAKAVSSLSSLLVCIDGSEHSIKALKYAVNFAESLGSKITLLNVQERRLYDYSSKTAEEVAERILSKALNAVGGKGLEIDKKVEFGVPSDKIVEVAAKGNYELIIVGSRGLGTVRRFLLGGISDDVCNKAKCSVLIVPARA